MEDQKQKKCKKWRKPVMQTMSQREVDNAIVLNACSSHSCINRALRTV